MLNFIRRYWLGLTCFTFCVITVASLIPLPELPVLPGSDKTHHLIAYALLTFPVVLRKPPRWQLIAVSFALWGGVIELIQPYVNRYGEWLDFAANASGVLCAVVSVLILEKMRLMSGNRA